MRKPRASSLRTVSRLSPRGRALQRLAGHRTPSPRHGHLQVPVSQRLCSYEARPRYQSQRLGRFAFRAVFVQGHGEDAVERVASCSSAMRAPNQTKTKTFRCARVRAWPAGIADTSLCLIRREPPMHHDGARRTQLRKLSRSPNRRRRSIARHFHESLAREEARRGGREQKGMAHIMAARFP